MAARFARDTLLRTRDSRVRGNRENLMVWVSTMRVCSSRWVRWGHRSLMLDTKDSVKVEVLEPALTTLLVEPFMVREVVWAPSYLR